MIDSVIGFDKKGYKNLFVRFEPVGNSRRVKSSFFLGDSQTFVYPDMDTLLPHRSQIRGPNGYYDLLLEFKKIGSNWMISKEIQDPNGSGPWRDKSYFYGSGGCLKEQWIRNNYWGSVSTTKSKVNLQNGNIQPKGNCSGGGYIDFDFDQALNPFKGYPPVLGFSSFNNNLYSSFTYGINCIPQNVTTYSYLLDSMDRPLESFDSDSNAIFFYYAK